MSTMLITGMHKISVLAVNSFALPPYPLTHPSFSSSSPFSFFSSSFPSFLSPSPPPSLPHLLTPLTPSPTPGEHHHGRGLQRDSVTGLSALGLPPLCGGLARCLRGRLRVSRVQHRHIPAEAKQANAPPRPPGHARHHVSGRGLWSWIM